MKRALLRLGFIIMLCLSWASLAFRSSTTSLGEDNNLHLSLLQENATETPYPAVDVLLQEGNRYFEKNYFVSPPGSNALEKYQEVLGINPYNKNAWNKLVEMSQIIKNWADNSYAQDHQAEAITFYQQYLQVASVMKDTPFYQSSLNAEMQVATSRLQELGSQPAQAQSTETTSTYVPTPEITAVPSAIETSSDGSTMEIIQDYYQRYQQGEDIWGELNQNPLFLPLFISALIILAGSLIFTIYMTLIRPRVKRRPLVKALRLLESKSEAELRVADELLAKAITSGLDKQSIDEAQFAQIYVKAQLKEYDRATGLMEEYLSKALPDRETLYLAIWLFIRQKEYEKVSEIYEKHGALVQNFLDARMLFGIGYLNLGQQSWERHDVKAAIRCFNTLKNLDVLTEYVPKQIDDHYVVLGINSLFDGKVELAREHFEKVLGDEKKSAKVLFEAKLGLLICDWKEQELPDVDARLGELIDAIPAASLDEQGKILFRHTLLWHVVALLFQWYQLPERGGLPQPEMEKALGRIEKIKQLESTHADANLLHGLLLYFFSAKQSEEAVAVLKQSLDQGVNVPEVIDLVRREQKLQAHRREVTKQYLQLVKKYLNDTSVPLSLREDLKRHLHKFSRFQPLEKEVGMGSQEDDAMPSLQDIQNRGLLLYKRVNSIVQPRLGDAAEADAQKITTLLEMLNSTALSLSETKSSLEQTEQALMVHAGEFLLIEEEKPASEELEDVVAESVTVAVKPSKRRASKGGQAS